MSIESYSAFDVSPQADLTLDYDERAGLVLRKQIRGQSNVIISICFRSGRTRQRHSPAESGQRLANLWNKNYDQREDGIRQRS